MKKAIKIIAIIVIAIVAIVLTLPLWDSPILRPIACQIAPQITKTPLTIGELHLNEYLGRVIVKDLTLENPKEYEQRVALSVGSLVVDVDMTTALSDVVVVEKIAINDVFISYVKDDKGINNFDQIISNADGYDLRDEKQSKEYAAKKEQAKAEAKAKEEAEAKAVGGDVSAPRKKPALGGKKFIVDRFELKGVKVQYGPITMPVPPIVLTELGRKEGGLTPDEMWALVYATFWRSLNALGISLKDIGVDVGNMAEVLKDVGIENTDKALDAIKDIKIDEKINSVGEGADKAVKALKGLFK